MSNLKERLPQFLEMRKEDLPILLQNAANPLKDRNGCSTSVVKGALRSIGVAEFVLDGNVKSFRQNLSNVAKIRLSLFERYRAGESIDNSYVTMLAYKNLFDALAAGDFETAKQLAEQMNHTAINFPNDVTKFDYSLGSLLAAMIVINRNDAERNLAELLALCEKKFIDFIGYCLVFRGILDRDNQLVSQGLPEIVKGHKKQAKRGVFNLTDDEVLCVWGVGVANLARHHGLAAHGVEEWIPEKLLI